MFIRSKWLWRSWRSLSCADAASKTPGAVPGVLPGILGEMPEVRVGQVWQQVSKHERGMQLKVVRTTGRRWVLRPVGGGPSKKRGLREGLWTLSSEQLNATCQLVRGVD